MSPPCFPNTPPSVLLLHLYITPITHALNSKAPKVQEKICYHQSLMQIRRASCLDQLSLLNITEHNQNPWMQILFSRPLNKKELAFQEGSIDTGFSKALAHVCSLMMTVRKEAVTEAEPCLARWLPWHLAADSDLQEYCNMLVHEEKNRQTLITSPRAWWIYSICIRHLLFLPLA